MKYVKLLLQLLISVFFIYLAFKNIDFKESLNELGNIQVHYLIIGMIFHFSSFFIRAFRWKNLVEPIKKIRYSSSFQVLTVSYAANNVLPFRLGDVLRAYWIGNKEGIDKISSFSTVLTERISDGLTLLLFLTVGLSFVSKSESWVTMTMIVASVIFAVAIIFIILLVKYKSKFIQLILYFIPTKYNEVAEKIKTLLNNMLSGFEVVTDRNNLMRIVALSILVWVLEASIFTFVLMSFNVSLDDALLAGLVTVSIVNLGIMIPSSPGYVGTFEYFTILGLTLFFNEKLSFAGAYSVMVHTAQYLPVTVTGCVMWFFMRKRKQTLGGDL